MLVFPVLALAQVVATLGSSTICANSASQRSVSSSVTCPSATKTLTGKTSIFNFFSVSPDQPSDERATWGDSIHENPGDLHRIYFQNIDGLRNDTDEMALYVSSMAQLNVGTF